MNIIYACESDSIYVGRVSAWVYIRVFVYGDRVYL